ncbi:MAG: hypothetical protein CSA81_13575 [Acidobacteria bacterium]|nr:MAG: hypothetical protein CSA81_13575 [Acidobacteriota bacterium]
MLSQQSRELTNSYLFDITAVESRKESGRSVRRWDALLTESVIGNYLVVPLVSSKMLRSEAFWMNNCVNGYQAICAAGDYALFSIRTCSGERLATLGMKKNESSWFFDQCFGPENSKVLEENIEYIDEDGILQVESYPTDIYYIAQEVVRLQNNMEIFGVRLN